MDGVSTPYTGRSDGGRAVGCKDDGRPSYLPVVETDPAAVDGARRAVLARLASAPLPVLQGQVMFSKVPAVKSKAPKRAFANAGKPVTAPSSGSARSRRSPTRRVAGRSPG